MPTIAENVQRWTNYPWTRHGNEWSPGESEAGTRILWWRTLAPRIHSFLPAGTILEIGPGFGRWSQYLRTFCDRLVLVDLTERCIDFCRQRFAGDPNVECVVNDGLSLEMVRDGSVDFVFSFDSLVHAEADAIGSYVGHFPRILKPGGAAFIHHSNLGAYARSGDVARYVTRRHWRSASVSARVFREACRRAALHCRSQEVINWLGRGGLVYRGRLSGRCIPLTDCFSIVDTVTAPAAPTAVVINSRFVEERREADWMARLYAADPPVPAAPAPRSARPLQQRVGTDISLLRHKDAAGLARVARDRLSPPAERRASWLKQRAVGEIVRWREPTARALRARRCPDCGLRLQKRATGLACGRCAVVFAQG